MYETESYEYFRKEKRDEAIDELFNEDVRLLAEVVIDEFVGKHQDHIQDIFAMALNYALFSQSDNVSDDILDGFIQTIEEIIQKAPFFEDLVEEKILDMWDRGDTI